MPKRGLDEGGPSKAGSIGLPSKAGVLFASSMRQKLFRVAIRAGVLGLVMDRDIIAERSQLFILILVSKVLYKTTFHQVMSYADAVPYL